MEYVDGLQFVALLTGTLLLLSLFPFLRRSRGLQGVALAVALGVPATVWQIETLRPARLEETEVSNRPIQVRENDYVSSKTCQSCHPHQYATWFGSYHRSMTQVASAETVIGDFDGVERQAYGRSFRLGREHGSFFIEMDDPSGGGLIRRPVVMTTGSHHMQAYWYATGKRREVSLAPLVYLKEDRRWIPERSSFLKPQVVGMPDFSGLWNRGCQQCHATAQQPHLAGMDTKVAELGIACEACHGPAEEHVRVNSDPQRRYRYHDAEEGDPTIVNPRRLTAERSGEVCGQCHSLWEAVDTPELSRSAAGGFSYRPGDELIRSKYVFHRENMAGDRMRAALADDPHYLEDRFWPDGTMRVAGREFTGLLDTPCFNHDDPEKAKMTCLHCHVMHKPQGDPRSIEEWADDQLGLGMEGNQACLQCHAEYGETLEEHTRHPGDSAGSLCYNCHMPYTSYALLKAIRSHTVDSPSMVSSLQSGRPNACNQCHLDRTFGWTADHLQKWYGHLRPRLSEEQETVAASVLWVLSGDAGQRALVAWTMGWDAAREASRSDWMIPYLGQLLPDPYDAVRYIAIRSLRSLPGLSGFEYDFLGSESHRTGAFAKAVHLWSRRRERTTGRRLLIDESGRIDEKRWEELLSKRNNRRVSLEE